MKTMKIRGYHWTAENGFEQIYKCPKCGSLKYTKLKIRKSKGLGKYGTPENPHNHHQLYVWCAKCRHYSQFTDYQRGL